MALSRSKNIFSKLSKIIKIPLNNLRGITSKNNGDFYCLNCLHSFRTKSKLESHKKVCEN